MDRPQQNKPEFNYKLSHSSRWDPFVLWRLVPDPLEEDIPKAWVYLKVNAQKEKESYNTDLQNISVNLATICADLDVGIIIGSYRGLYVSFLDEFFQQRIKAEKYSTAFVKIIAEADHGLFEDSEVSQYLEQKTSELNRPESIDLRLVTELESFASTCVIIGESNSTDEIAVKFIAKNKAVFPFGNQEIFPKRIEYLEEDKFKRMYQTMLSKDDFKKSDEALLSRFSEYLSFITPIR